MTAVTALILGYLQPGQAAAPTAAVVIERAYREADRENKCVFVHFGASWCGPCHKLDALLESKAVSAVMRKYFVVVKLDLNEAEQNQALENKGADAFLERLGGKDLGLPYYAVVDAKGEVRARGRREMDGKVYGSYGYPNTYGGIEPFLRTLDNGNPKMTNDDLWTLRRYLESQLK